MLLFIIILILLYVLFLLWLFQDTEGDDEGEVHLEVVEEGADDEQGDKGIEMVEIEQRDQEEKEVDGDEHMEEETSGGDTGNETDDRQKQKDSKQTRGKSILYYGLFIVVFYLSAFTFEFFFFLRIFVLSLLI